MLTSRDDLRRFIPRPVFSVYHEIRARLNRWKCHSGEYGCNVCLSSLREWIHAMPLDHGNFVCPVCYSYGRHRMMAKVIERELVRYNSIGGKKWLHFAPEVGFRTWLMRHLPQVNYRSADLFSPDVDLCLDLQDIALANDSIDAVILSHVLEHVDNDARALRELNRILVPGGRLFVQVPLSGQETIDDKLDTVPQLGWPAMAKPTTCGSMAATCRIGLLRRGLKWRYILLAMNLIKPSLPKWRWTCPTIRACCMTMRAQRSYVESRFSHLTCLSCLRHEATFRH